MEYFFQTIGLIVTIYAISSIISKHKKEKQAQKMKFYTEMLQRHAEVQHLPLDKFEQWVKEMQQRYQETGDIKYCLYPEEHSSELWSLQKKQK